MTHTKPQNLYLNINRQALRKLYALWVNEYASIDTFAEHHGLYEHEALALIELSRSCFENNHPDE